MDGLKIYGKIVNQNEKAAGEDEMQSVRSLRRRGAIIDRSPWNNSSATKAASMRPEPAKRPMTTEELQGCWMPPYCRASRKEIMKPMMSAVPRGSICRSFSRRGAAAGMAWGGVEKQNSMMTAETPPIGKLM